MSLRDSYAAFLANPSTGALAENATLHYITTLTSIHDATAILKHLAVQEKQLKKKSQKVLSAVEGSRGISLDVDTTIEFQTGGGAYLPGLDDNFVSDRTVTFPMVHMVHFDNAGKIVQIRLYWDQGALLKQIDVIGARSRNWPIRDSKEQSRLIATAAAAQPDSEPASRRSTTSRGADEVSIASRSRGSTTNAMNDPHASLSLFQNRSAQDDEDSHNSQPIAARAQSAKPPPREYSELFVGENSGSPSPSPQKIPVKGGGGQNYKASRLFEDVEEEEEAVKGAGIKTNPKKYEHFTFGQGEDEPVRNTARDETKKKSTANWNFEDFATPNKTKPKTQPQAVRHFGWSDDEVGPYYQPEIPEEVSPVRRPIVHAARPDADPHFEFVDDGTPEAQRTQMSTNTKGRVGNKGMGLYQDHVMGTTAGDADATPYDDDIKRPLSDVSKAIRSQHHNKDFAAHFDINDNSPAGSKNAQREPVIDNHKATKSNWSLYETAPETRAGINIAGNGMGSRKTNEAAFSLFDEASGPRKENVGNTGRQAAPRSAHPEPEVEGASGINIAGNGMGSRKTNDPAFSLFDDSAPAERPIHPKMQAPQREARSESKAEGASGINIAGNGMGSRKTNAPAFSLFDESSPAERPIHPKMQAPQREARTDAERDGSSGINIAGNGMGSRKTNEAAFSLFDDSPAKERNSISANKQSQAQGKRSEGDGMGGKKGGESFWDF